MTRRVTKSSDSSWPALVLVTAALAVAASLVAGSQVGWAGTDISELRAGWLDPSTFESDEAIGETLDKVVQTKLNTVFVAAPPSHGNHGLSSREQFAKLLKAASGRGLSVHAWVNSRWRKGWGTKVDYRDLDEQRAQVNWILGLLDQYPELDGVHLDQIRYDEWGAPDAGGKMDAVTSTVSAIHRALKRRHPNKFLTATSHLARPTRGAADSELDGRELDVPKWFRDWVKSHPESEYSAEPKEEGVRVPQHMKCQQDPVAWIELGIVDALVPVVFSEDDEDWQAEVDLWRGFLGDDIGKVGMGLGWWYEIGHDGWEYNMSGPAKRIKYGRSQGVKGFVIVVRIGDAVGDDSRLIDTLTRDGPANDHDAPFEEPARSPLRAPEAGSHER